MTCRCAPVLELANGIHVRHALGLFQRGAACVIALDAGAFVGLVWEDVARRSQCCCNLMRQARPSAHSSALRGMLGVAP